MNYEERLEKLASGEIKGVRLERSTEWITQVIATGFLFLGGIVRAAMTIRTGEPVPVQPSESLVVEDQEPDAVQMGLPVPDPSQPVEEAPRRGRPKTKSYPAIESEPEE